jgi:hypothetical protein
VGQPRAQGDAHNAECCNLAPEGAKKITPFAIAAAAVGKAVVARRVALGHELKPVVDTFPRFVA